jgi:hypothetical protein
MCPLEPKTFSGKNLLIVQVIQGTWELNERANQVKREHPKAPRKEKQTGPRYVSIIILPNDPYYAMAKRGGQVLEHRYVMAQHIGRCLESWEVVHHIDGQKHNNAIENLELLPNSTAHVPYTMLQNTLQDMKGELHKKDTEITTLKNNGLTEAMTSHIPAGMPFISYMP